MAQFGMDGGGIGELRDFWGYDVSTTRTVKKRLVICCDGTWQSSVSDKENCPSNITRLARSIAAHATDKDGQEWLQIVYYDSGVGTGDLGWMEAAGQGGTGRGLATNVIEAYNFIVNNYMPGDEIMCFGFSRGAFTARAVAGLVNDIGVLRPFEMDEFPALYRAYQTKKKGDQFRETRLWFNWLYGDPQTKGKAETTGNMYGWHNYPHAYKKYDDECREVKIVGVFDTVGSLGIPDGHLIKMGWFNKGYAFHNVQISPYIRHAFHALALDEHRGPFSPTLWYIPEPETQDQSEKKMENLAAECEKMKSQALLTNEDKDRDLWFDAWQALQKCKRMKDEAGRTKNWKETDEDIHTGTQLRQVWFPGVHINAGGGSGDLLGAREGDLEQLASVTFHWMIDQCRPYLAFDKTAISAHKTLHGAKLDQIVKEKNLGTGKVAPYLWQGLDWTGMWPAKNFTVSDIVRTGWGIGPIIDSRTGIMALAASKYRSPGETVDADGRLLSEMGNTHEYIHPITQYRIEKYKEEKFKDKGGYDPMALRGFARMKRQDGKPGFDWVKTKEDGQQVIVHEWPLPQHIDYGESQLFPWERTIIKDQDALDWIGSVDAEYGVALSSNSPTPSPASLQKANVDPIS